MSAARPKRLRRRLQQLEADTRWRSVSAPAHVDAQRLIFTTLNGLAVERILMPGAVVRLSAGRRELTEEAQALCFLAGANSIFVGDELLTTPNPDQASDATLLNKLGLEPCPPRSTNA